MIKHKLNGKDEYVVFCELTSTQYEIYQRGKGNHPPTHPNPLLQ